MKKQLQIQAVLALALVAPALMAAKAAPVMEGAKVLSQNVDSSQAGAYAAPIGLGAIAVPIYRRSNTVEVQLRGFRETWVEAPGRHFVILPVGGVIAFYRDGKWFIVTDSAGKKHKFSMLSQMVTPLPAPKTGFPDE